MSKAPTLVVAEAKRLRDDARHETSFSIKSATLYCYLAENVDLLLALAGEGLETRLTAADNPFSAASRLRAAECPASPSVTEQEKQK